MRSKVPIIVGDSQDGRHYATIKYVDLLQSYLVIFFQRRDAGNVAPVKRGTSKRLNDALSAAIDWVDEDNEVVRFKRAEDARSNQSNQY